MSTRRGPDESVHDFQHRLIDKRIATYNAVPRTDPFTRRQCGNSAWWSLTGHVRAFHKGIVPRSTAPFLNMTYDELAKLHNDDHEV